MNSKTALAVLLLAAPLAAFATPTKISYEDAFALFTALNQIQPGLTAGNVGKAAENIWQLKGTAEAYQTAAGRSARDSERAKAAKDPLDASQRAQDDWDHFRLSEVTLDLQPLALTDDEVKEAKITPGIYAPILHYLTAKAAPK